MPKTKAEATEPNELKICLQEGEKCAHREEYKTALTYLIRALEIVAFEQSRPKEPVS